MTAKQLIGNLKEGTQVYKVLAHMMNNGTITTYQAYDLYGITRLPARISDLTALGVEIDRKCVYSREHGTHWNEYWLKEGGAYDN